MYVFRNTRYWADQCSHVVAALLVAVLCTIDSHSTLPSSTMSVCLYYCVPNIPTPLPNQTQVFGLTMSSPHAMLARLLEEMGGLSKKSRRDLLNRLSFLT